MPVVSRRARALLRPGELERFIDGVVEALRGPLTRLRGATTALLGAEAGPLSTEQTETVQNIEQATTALGELVDDLVDLTGSSRSTGEQESVDVAELCAALVREHQVRLRSCDPARSERVELSVEGRAAAPRILLNGRQLRRVVSNLLENAIKFTDQGRICVACEARADGTVEIVVTDTGRGIDPVELPYVFDHFTRGGVAAGSRQGSGLGLAICKRLVELQGGRISVQSALGAGSSFTVTFSPGRRQPASHATPANVSERASRAWPARLFAPFEVDEGFTVERDQALQLAGMSHDLRSPLSSIIGLSELMGSAMMGELNAAQLRLTEQVRRSGRDLLQLIDGVLDVARVESGQLQSTREDVAPAEIVARALRMLEDRDPTVAARIESSCDAHLPPVRVDGVRLADALVYLVRFCWRKNPAARLHLGASIESGSPERSTRGLRLRVSAPTIELGQRELNREIERSRARWATEGMAFELPLAKAFAESHGGALEIRGAGGEGLVLSLEVPLAS